MSKTQKRIIGDFGEDEAVKHLEQKGYRIIKRNHNCRFGEIDIIARKEDLVVFVEVKTRGYNYFGLPQEAVDYYKLRKINNAIDDFLIKNIWVGDEDLNTQIDVIEVFLDNNGKLVKINHIENFDE